MKIAALLLAASLALAPLAVQAQPRNADEKAIYDLVGKWNQMIAAKDLEGVVNLYAPDGLIMPAGSPAAQGHPALKQVWTGMLGLPGLKATLTPIQVDVASGKDMAVERGRYELTTSGPNGPVTERGKYLVVWKKVGGDWKVAADMFSSDAPAA
jgi:uncharacterized protein (TIGR02246 family)